MSTQDAGNAAFRSVLERVIAEERVAMARILSVVRLAIVPVAASISIWSVLRGRPDLLPTAITGVLWTALAVAAFVALRKGWVVERSGYVVPLLDAPLLAVTQIVQTKQLAVPLLGMMTTPTIMLSLVALSTLSLSRTAIVATSAVGLVPFLYRAVVLDVRGTLYLSLFAWLGTTAVLVAVVGRMRGLVHKSRANDLLGKYLLGRRLGAGGMAEVFEATYSPEGGLERRVALKRIHPSHLGKPEAVELLRREASLGAQLHHPGVVQVLDYGRQGDTWFLALEYVDGVSLRELQNFLEARATPLPIEAVVTLTWQLAEALDYLHTRTDGAGQPLKLVHRDLNPPNVLITRAGEAKVADFGIAVVATEERLTATGVVRGKLGYSAPEQLLGVSTDPRSDLFALGVTLWECLTGRRLFQGTSDLALVRACLEEPLAKPSTLRSDTPPELDDAIMRLLERDLDRRTPSAGELKRSLRHLEPQVGGRKTLGALVTQAQLAKPGAAPTAPEVQATRTTERPLVTPNA